LEGLIVKSIDREKGQVTVEDSEGGTRTFLKGDVSLGRWGPAGPGGLSFREFVVGRLGEEGEREEGESVLSVYPPRQWNPRCHKALCQVVAAALSERGVQGLLDLCAALEIGVRTYAVEEGKVVPFWGGKPISGGGPDGKAAKQLGYTGYNKSPKGSDWCQVGIDVRYLPQGPEGSEGRGWDTSVVLVSFHDAAVPSEKRIDKPRARGRKARAAGGEDGGMEPARQSEEDKDKVGFDWKKGGSFSAYMGVG
jgi:hypothetical protein